MQDVGILYQIINSAEQFPGVESNPFRAIFSAYDRVLPENGLDPNHDQVYLRFLFRLGGRREDGDSLFETFEKLLDDLGIQIEFNSEDDEINEVTRDLALNSGRSDEETQNIARPPRRARRRSANSAYDAEDESTRPILSPAGSRASDSVLQISKKVGTKVRPASRATTRPTERTSNLATPKRLPTFTAGKRLTALEWTEDLEQRQRERRLFADQEPQRLPNDVVNHFRRQPSNGEVIAAEGLASDDGDYAEKAPRLRNQLAVENPSFILSSKDKFYSPSRTQLLRDAETFQSYRIRSVARDAIDKWCFAAMEARDQHVYMERVAIAHDKEILLRQALEHWRLRLHEKKQAALTMRYFQHLERRAEKARNLYLLTKAFTHWAQCAKDEVQRLSLARHHILSVKYFNAWRDLTITNQRKVHEHGLRKYFDCWRTRYVQNITNDIKADLAHQRHLMRSAYWNWFWGFCEARAPAWQDGRLKQRMLSRWLTTFRMNRRRNQQVTLHIEIAAKRYFISKWLDKTKKTLREQEAAATYCRQTLTAKVLSTWIRIHRHGPILQQVSNMVDWRVARKTFAIFVNGYRQQKQAERLDQLRLKRNAWTQWNDHLRWQTMARQVDDRCLLEALYKWTIAERLQLFTRLFHGRLKGRYLMTLRDVWSSREKRRGEISRAVESQLARRALQVVLSHWQLTCKTMRQNDQIAVDFHNPRVTYEALTSLSARAQDIKILNEKANHSADYFMLKHTMKKWHSAFIASKRRKRRDAYIQIRRKLKMRLASDMLQRWQSATIMARRMKSEALQFDHDRVLQLVANSLIWWKVAYDRAVDQHLQATSHFEEHLLLRQFRSGTIAQVS